MERKEFIKPKVDFRIYLHAVVCKNQLLDDFRIYRAAPTLQKKEE